MDSTAVFRCPFEMQGTKDGTILDILLSGTRLERLTAMRCALEQLRTERQWSSLRFILPDSIVAGCDSLELLRERILPYQAEFLAADIDCRLYPHLPYHSAWQRFIAHLKPSHRHARYATRALEVALYTGGYGTPGSLSELCTAIQRLFADQIALGDPDPICIFGSIRKAGEKFWLFRMERGAFAIYQDQNRLHDPLVNDAHFSIVKAPLYPRGFGRFSEHVEIAVTRDIDVALLPEMMKFRIRREANEVHRAHGVRIQDPTFTQQPTGLWIPEKKY